MYEAYEKSCQENGLAVESEQAFNRKMAGKFGYQRKQLRYKGERHYFYLRVGLSEWKQREKKELNMLEDLSKFSYVTQEKMK